MVDTTAEKPSQAKKELNSGGVLRSIKDKILGRTVKPTPQQPDQRVVPSAETEGDRFDEEKFRSVKLDMWTIIQNPSYRTQENFAQAVSKSDILARALTADADRFYGVMHLLSHLATVRDFPQASVFARSFVEKNLSLIDTRIELSQESRVIVQAFHTVSTLFDSEDQMQQSLAMAMLAKHFERLLRHGYIDEIALEVIEKTLLHANADQLSKAQAALIGTARNQDLQKRFLLGKLAKYCELRSSPILEQVRKLEENVLASYGLDLNALREAWKQSSNSEHEIGTGSLKEIEEINITTIHILEHERPGICKLLQDEFGIKNFARYPADLLIKQYDEREDTSLPYVVVIEPFYDHNAILYEENPKIFRDWSARLGNKYAARVVECDNKEKTLVMLAKLRKNYGKISAAVLNVHGAEEVLAFGSPKEEANLLLISDLEKPFSKTTTLRDGGQVARQIVPASVFRYLFKDDATILFLSCSTGKEAGIAQKVSEFGVETIAPAGAIKVVQCEPIIDDGKKFDFAVEYTGKDLIRRYKRGELISTE